VLECLFNAAHSIIDPFLVSKSYFSGEGLEATAGGKIG